MRDGRGREEKGSRYKRDAENGNEMIVVSRRAAGNRGEWWWWWW